MKVKKKTAVPKGIVLINNGKKYLGKHVAVANFNSRKVVASGNNPIKVRKRAIKKGFKNPVIFFVLEGKCVFKSEGWINKDVKLFNKVVDKISAKTSRIRI